MLIYSTLAGSRLYGYAIPESDYDYRGVYLAPSEQLLGISRLVESTNSIFGNIDTVNYELRKFCSLALKGNPNILEILFSTAGVITTSVWDRLFSIRHAFLSQQVRAPYSGFLFSELKQLEKEYSAKKAANAWRLVNQGIKILSAGDLNPTLSTSDAIFMKAVRAGSVSKESIMPTLYALDKKLKETHTELPQYPSTELVSKLVETIYKEYFFEDYYESGKVNNVW
jgi:predicted nucleotidyltransferase